LSRIGWYKSRIRVQAPASFEVLKKSLEIVAEEHSGRLTNYVMDSVGGKTYCDMAVVTPSFSRGVGVKIDRDTGEVTFLYDEYGGFGGIARKIVEEITQNYVAITLIRAMRSLGYYVEDASEGRETIVLVGRI
jgi:hypothetical protein